MIHGLWMHGLLMNQLSRRLARATGWPTDTFSYRTVSRALPENARRLKRRLELTSTGRIHLVGFSLGGVLALQMLNLFPTDRVGRIVCIGSPLVDSSVARRLSRWELGRKMVGRTLRQGVLDQPLLSVEGDREVGVIAGSAGIGVGRLVGGLEVPHDGAVSVAETQLPGISDHVVLPLGHLGLAYSRRTAEMTARFLQLGRFA